MRENVYLGMLISLKQIEYSYKLQQCYTRVGAHGIFYMEGFCGYQSCFYCLIIFPDILFAIGVNASKCLSYS